MQNTPEYIEGLLQSVRNDIKETKTNLSYLKWMENKYKFILKSLPIPKKDTK